MTNRSVLQVFQRLTLPGIDAFKMETKNVNKL